MVEYYHFHVTQGIKMNRHIIFVTLPLCSIINFSYAGGFQMHEQNASIGDVHANHSVNTKDASVNFYNPAGLTDILESTVTNSAVTVANKISFKGYSVVKTDPEPDPRFYPPISGSGKSSTDGLHVIPALHYATPINDKFAFGLSVASPFAAELDWPNKNFTRYNSTLNGIKTINFTPSIAYKINNQLSLGFGPEIQYVDMQINKIVGTSYDYTFDDQDPRIFDSLVTNNLTNTGFGWHAGILWKPANQLKIGYSYRSNITHKAEGQSKLKGRLAGDHEDPSTDKVNKSKNLKATIRIPSTMALSMQFSPNHDFELVSTVIYTRWNVVKYFNLENVPAAFSDVDNHTPLYIRLVQNTLDFKNTFTVLNGLHWHYNNRLTLKSGFGFDQTPTSNNHRDLKMPDGDRFLFGLGANYDYSKNINFEFGWMYVNIPTIKINKVAVIPPPAIDNPTMNPGEISEIYGKARGYAHIIGLQVTFSPQKVMNYFI